MSPTLGFLPFVPSTETEITPIAHPFLDVVHSWMAPAPAPISQPPKPLDPDSPEAAVGSGGAQVTCLSRVRVRIFHNGNLGRANDWAVIISELPEQPDGGAFERWVNPGAPPRPHLDQLATQIKRLHLPLAPAAEILWFFHQPLVLLGAHLVYRVHFSLHRLRGWAPKHDVYFGYYLDPISGDELELATGGLVDL